MVTDLTFNVCLFLYFSKNRLLKPPRLATGWIPVLIFRSLRWLVDPELGRGQDAAPCKTLTSPAIIQLPDYIIQPPGSLQSSLKHQTSAGITRKLPGLSAKARSVSANTWASAPDACAPSHLASPAACRLSGSRHALFCDSYTVVTRGGSFLFLSAEASPL